MVLNDNIFLPPPPFEYIAGYSHDPKYVNTIILSIFIFNKQFVFKTLEFFFFIFILIINKNKKNLDHYIDLPNH